MKSLFFLLKFMTSELPLKKVKSLHFRDQGTPECQKLSCLAFLVHEFIGPGQPNMTDYTGTAVKSGAKKHVEEPEKGNIFLHTVKF